MIPAISQSNPTVLTTLTAKSTANPKPPPPTISPTTLTLKSLVKSGRLEHAVHLIESQPSNPPISDPEAYTLLLHACISRRSLQHGRRIYRHLSTTDRHLLRNPAIKSRFITLFSICKCIDEAAAVFRHDLAAGEFVPESVWVAMAIGFSRNRRSEQALLVYSEMLLHSVAPGNFAFSTALKASIAMNNLRVGKSVHAQIVKSAEEPDQVVRNSLLGLYGQCGSSDDAFKVFESMSQRDIVSWNSMLSNFVARDLVFEAIEMFRRMQGEGLGFSWVTLTTVLSLCVRATALRSGKEIHLQMVKSTEKPDTYAMNSLLDMYAKCGEIDYCKRVFDEMNNKDLTSWNTILTGYAINGLVEEALNLFEKMVETSGFKPDGVTFIALLSGCSHAGLTDSGRKLFKEMKSVHGLDPKTEHYACLVDLLGRAGLVKEALEITETMPMKPGSSVWGSLLNSCRLHKNVPLGEFAAQKLFELEPSNPGNYVMLSNIYATAGMWDRVNGIRDTMDEKGIKKSAGCSWTQVGNGVHTFVAGGGFGFRNSAESQEIWSELNEAMEESGYRADTSVVLHDVDDETKATWVCGHSERLAATFALVKTSFGAPIRITKNLRVCVDCHSWMKHVSQITERLIVLRDTNRFHHFRDGKCSCKDYW